MRIQIFRKIMLDFKYYSPVFRKYHCLNCCFPNVSYKHTNTNFVLKSKVLLSYFSNERKLSTTKEIPLYQRSHTGLLKGPLCSQSSIRINSIHLHALAVSGARHYSNSADLYAKQVIMYNNYIFRYISESLPVEYLMDALRTVHYSTGLPWWATIMLMTFASRTLITLPLSVHQHQVTAKLWNLKQEMKGVSERLNMEIKLAMVNSNWSPQYAKMMYATSMKNEWRETIQRENCHPFKVVAMVILQMPLWLCSTFALRNFCLKFPHLDAVAEQDYLELANGGFGWITNLTVMDPTFTLPVIFAVSNLILIEVQQVLYPREKTRFMKGYTIFLRGITLVMAGVLAYVPSCLTLFWTTNTIYTLLQNILLMSPQFRRLGRIPKTDSELQQPYSELYKKLRRKLRLPTKMQ